MLTTPTVFVLGAGVSAPFKFPIGWQLTQHVVSQLGEGGACYEPLRTLCEFSPDKIMNFREALLRSGKNSIDAFLEHRVEYLKIGKAATASALIRYEREDMLFRYEDNWLRYLFDQLNTSFEEFGENRLSIITFNYDRIVEHFLFTALKNSYGKSDSECAAVLRKIPIIHLHGRLGYLPWQKNQDGRAFTKEIDFQGLVASIENIKIIHEDISDGRDKEFEEAKQILHKAERIYFIGFGYNKTNVDRLEISRLEPGRAVGSTHGLVQREIDDVSVVCDGRLRLVSQYSECLEFLRNHVVWR